MHVIVIGAGLLGTTTAYYLAADGHRVSVIERAPDVARETSFANGGILHASYAAPWNSPAAPGQFLRWIGRRHAPLAIRLRALPGLARWGPQFLFHCRSEPFERALLANAQLAVYSGQQLDKLRAHTQLDYHANTEGSLAIFHSGSELRAAMHEAEQVAHLGITSHHLTAAALREREPALAETRLPLVGGLHYPDDQSGDARLFTESLAARARELGVMFHFATPVTGIAREGRRVTGVHTGQDTRPADACVLAAGSYSPLLARSAGLRLPICPIKGYSISIPLTPQMQVSRLPIIDSARKIVLTRLGDHLRVAGIAEFAGYDTRTDPRRIRALLADAADLFPDLRDSDPEALAPWAGLRPTTANGRPLLGQSSVPGLYLATGTGHLGWTFAPGAGRIVADVVSGRRPALATG